MRSVKEILERSSLAICLLLLTGCSPEDWLGSSDRTWLWSVAPLAVLLVFGSSSVFARRKSQLEGWSIEKTSTEPSIQSIVVWALGVAGGLAVVFTIYNLRLGIDPSQKIWNIVSWWFGTAVGVAAALFVGFKLAEWRS